MQNRLMAQQNVRCQFEGKPYFTAALNYIAFRTSSTIKIKSLNKNVKELQINTSNSSVKHFTLENFQSNLYLFMLTNSQLIIYSLQKEKDKIEHTNILELDQVQSYEKHSLGIVVVTNDGFLKILTLQSSSQLALKNLKVIDRCQADSKIIKHEGKTILILQKSKKGSFYSHYGLQKEIFEKIADIQFISESLAFYNDRYIFQRTLLQEIEIFDIEYEKIIGKFSYSGTILHAEIKDSLLLVVTNNENLDSYYFFLLSKKTSVQNGSQNEEHPVIESRFVYERGNGSYFSFFNFTKQNAKYILSSKDQFMKLQPIQNIEKQTQSIIYTIPKNKQKIEIMKINHQKIIQSKFGEEKIGKVIQSKTNKKKVYKEPHSLEIEKQRINASKQFRKNEKSPEEIQKNFIEFLIQTKIKGVVDKFGELQKRIIKLQKQITNIYGKIEESIKKIQKQEIKKNVQSLFEQVTPQFQEYFNEVFKQISSVLDQGISYYNNKLSKQADLHRQAMVQLVNMTFDATQEVVELGRQELKFSQKSNEGINRLLEMRRHWEDQKKQNFLNFKHELANQINDKKIKLYESFKTSSKPPNYHKENRQNSEE